MSSKNENWTFSKFLESMVLYKKRNICCHMHAQVGKNGIAFNKNELLKKKCK